ncbi:MAG: cation transporter [Leptospira sp.]|nr:cation transporter [Leptospira sp.]
MKSPQQRTKIIRNVTLIGSLVNILLSVGKIFSGIYGKSSAMIADGIHSFSDLLTDIIVLSVSKISSKEGDYNHHYGHGKFETFATMLISFILFIVGAGIFWSGFSNAYSAYQGNIPEQPDMITIYAAIASLVSKEILFRLTLFYGESIQSSSLIANAWHHRSDAVSSIATLVGISGAIFLGEKWRILDPITSIFVSFFIMKVAWEIAHPSVSELLETALPIETQEQIFQIITNTPGVISYHKFKCRAIGDTIAIDVHIQVDKNLSIEKAHNISTALEKSIRDQFGESSHIGIHIEPYYP